jgi:hypothetical protein
MRWGRTWLESVGNYGVEIGHCGVLAGARGERAWKERVDSLISSLVLGKVTDVES